MSADPKKMPTADQESPFGPAIYTYTRKQAIEDGVLVDVSKLAREAGFKFPVAITRRVWDEVITPDERAKGYQDETGRAWDALVVLHYAIKRSAADADTVLFNPLFIMKKMQRRNIWLKSVVGPGDNGEGVITIMFPDED